MIDLRIAFELARRRWGGNGSGSTAANTRELAARLPALLTKHNVKTVVDLGCGEVSWIADVVPLLDLYFGVDVVPAAIAANRRRFPPTETPFRMHFVEIAGPDAPLPKVDLVICRDCIAHLPNAAIHATLAQISRAAPLALITNYPMTRANHDTLAGGFRPINLIMRPFLLDEPMAWLRDSDQKVMALWKTTSKGWPA